MVPLDFILSHSSLVSSEKSVRIAQDQRRIENVFLVNFTPGAIVTEEMVRQQFQRFGPICSITMCYIDGCQAFVVMHPEYTLFASSTTTVDRLLAETQGFLFVDGFLWTIERPSRRPPCPPVYDGPSPLRPRRAEMATTAESLNEIYRNFCQYHSSMSESSLSSRETRHSSSISTIYPPSQQTGFLQLAPPYHILPDTPFFRKAKIVPPPTRGGYDIPILQRIVNRYLESMEIHDNLMNETNFDGMSDDEVTIQIADHNHFDGVELRCPWWIAY